MLNVIFIQQREFPEGKEREKREIILNFKMFCVINVKYGGLEKEEKEEKSNFQKHRVNSCSKIRIEQFFLVYAWYIQLAGSF